MTPVETLLEELRSIAKDEHDKGARFEELMLHAFRTDRTFRQQFTNVWKWMDWPGRSGADIGVDLVATDAEGRLVAIQCKCYSPNATLTKEEIDSFVALSGQKQWGRRIVVATTDLWSTNALKSLEGHAIPIERIGIDDLEAMTVEWSSYDLANPSGLPPKERHTLRPHQVEALDAVRRGFEASDRGKLIMACGTGKTFTALRIAEEHAGAGKSVLFLAPSIALVAQSLKEWTAECEVPIRPFAVCSDNTAGKPLEGENATPHDLVVPPTTDPQALIDAGVTQLPDAEMTVVFSTYQSIEVVAAMQATTGLRFDLIVCDEAHRTAGVASVAGDDSAFALVHDDAVVPAAKRLYMTATPRLFKPVAADAAREADAILASMDDPEFFGEEFHRLGFGEAVERGLLADYRVLILTVDERAVSESFQELLSTNGELSLPDVARFVGCLSGLAKLPGAAGSTFQDGGAPMQRAVAFWSKIAESERFAEQFEQVAESYFDQLEAGPQGDDTIRLAVPTRHVDGTSKISSRRADIRWLKETPPDGECRVLTNAKCLTEGVDVPALDAVMFLTPRRSKIDIVQAVGRVMRKPPGKQLGYVILPVAVTAGLDPATALDQNRDYDAVWEVLQALRAHDERFNAYINRIALGSTKPGSGPDDPIKVIPVDIDTPKTPDELQGRLFEYEEWTGAIYTKIVQKVGTRAYWEDWARDVAAIAARHETRITAILDSSPVAASAFDEFLGELHATLNDSISRDDAVSMVSQHLITRPIFEALFGDDAFAAANPVSQAMSAIVAVLDEHSLETETEKLEDFYASVRRRVEGIHPDDGEARQRIIKDLYGRFFKIAFPRVADSLGIVYTPIEVVDFIIRATEAALAEHFDGASLSDEGVHVLDPFTGTGTFVTRLLQSGFIRPNDLERKFTNELHANELLLLAYYIAAINIETTYRQARTRLEGLDSGYQPFPGIVLTDTFQLGEGGDGSGTWDVFPINNARAERQKGLSIRVVFGNPPYSGGQESANDGNANLSYPTLDESIAATYGALSTATLKRKLYDSYVRAIRWATDRVKMSAHGGVIAFVTNSGYIDSASLDGVRLALASEFHYVYVFNLRGNQREGDWRREGGKIFDAGSQAGAAILLLVRKPTAVPTDGGQVQYLDIGDSLSRDEKLRIIAEAMPARDGRPPMLGDVKWAHVSPNESGDWINQRTASFTQHAPLHDESEESIFAIRTLGLASGRDAWNYNSSRRALDANVERMIAAYNAATDSFVATQQGAAASPATRTKLAAAHVDKDPTKFSWNDKAFGHVARGLRYTSADRDVRVATYRPFHRRWSEAGRQLNARAALVPRILPEADSTNLTVAVTTTGARSGFAALAVRDVPDLHIWPDGTVCVPLHFFDGSDGHGDTEPNLFSTGTPTAGPRHNVTDLAATRFRMIDSAIEKDDIFFYVYGVLHAPDYRHAFAADLKKSLPRIPQVSTSADFWAFATAGRELATLHTDYESIDPWPGLTRVHASGFRDDHPDAYRVLKMKHPKVTDPATGQKVEDRTRIVYNDWITICDIPERAYDYELGSRSAIGWVMDAWRVRTDKASGIVNDPNDWAIEHDDPTYIVDLVGRVVTVSMRTLEIVDSLPPLEL